MKKKIYKHYNPINDKIKEDLEKAYYFIVNDIGIDINRAVRNKLYPEYRSLFNTYALRKHILSPSHIANFHVEKGLKMSHDKVLHSISKFEAYCYYLPELKNYLHKLFPESNKNIGKKEVVKTMVIDKRELTPIQKLVTDLNSSQEAELIELIELRKKSWEWKSKDKITVYSGS